MKTKEQVSAKDSEDDKSANRPRFRARYARGRDVFIVGKDSGTIETGIESSTRVCAK